MAGVTVRVKEVSGVGTTTNAQGQYQLAVPAEARTLIFPLWVIKIKNNL